ncbi:NUDIX hydrolase [Caballeronia arationis]|uniref:NUDIX hydrolase n=1 Tax=Caballeronia arationis TaxID=1777142 RepID=UPI000B3556CD|nr:NUDIX domain-containing protein [Caballeronia arationis]
MKHRASVVCARNGRILLVRKRRGRWALPGGRRKIDESLSSTATRELLEETRIAALAVHYLFEFWGAATRHYVFVADFSTDAVAEPSSEIWQCQWVGFDEVQRLAASISTKGIVGIMSRTCESDRESRSQAACRPPTRQLHKACSAFPPDAEAFTRESL